MSPTVSGRSDQSLPSNVFAYRRQFVVGPRHPSVEGWCTWKLAKGLVLQTHPDLPCVQKAGRNKNITLLGFIIDPNRPELSDEAIVTSIIEQINHFEDLFACTSSLSGRWILIFEDESEFVLFQDACGLRSVVYTLPGISECWCASQTNLIADRLDVKPNPEALDFWSKLGKTIPKHIRAWPGASTAFSEIGALLPNHYLDLKTRNVVRFFPRQPLQQISLEDGTEKICLHLAALLRAVHERFAVFQEITAGLDSRCLLAASREVSKQTTYLTGLWTAIDPSLTEEHRDVRVPRNLLRSLGLKHRIVYCPSVPSEGPFASAYQTSDTLPLQGLAQRVYAMAPLLPENAILVNGNGGEIGRCRLHPVRHPQTVSLSAACNLHWTGLHSHPFLKPYLTAWLADASKACDKFGYRLFDIFYWEQKMARRVGKSFLHNDLAHETFSPYNTRSLLCEFLSVPEKYRRPGNGHILQHNIIRTLWPEALGEKINPLSPGDRALTLLWRLRRRARMLGVPV